MILFIVIIAFILIAGGLAWFFISHDHGEKEPISALWTAVGFGFLGAVAAGGLEYLLVPSNFIGQPGQPIFLVLLATLGIGLIEEACKFLPLAFFIYRKRYFNEHTDGIIYFALAGIGFGLPENILYSLNFGVRTGVARMVLTPIFHAATTGLVGYFLIKAKLNHQALYKTGIALVAVMILHGLYDFGLSSGNKLFIVLSLMITIGVSSFLFILFMRANELDKAEGLAVVGNNSFCRSCGHPNPKHSLYCEQCGQRA